MNNDKHLPILAGIITWSAVAYIEFQHLSGSPYATLGVIGYVIFLVLFAAVVHQLGNRQYYRQHRIFLHFQLLIALLLLLIHPSDLAPILLVVWAAQLADYFSRKRAILLVLFSNLAFYFIIFMFWKTQNHFVIALTFLGFQFFALGTAFARVSERQAREELEQVNQQLLATRIILAQSSKQEERLRIARDLHDILGHQLTALNLQLEILQHKVDQGLQSSVIETKQLAKQLLENIRAVVRDQRMAITVDIRQAVYTLATRLPELAVEIHGNLHLESAYVAEQLLLCIQEGISNALRHGNAKNIQLNLQQDNNQIRIDIDDNGVGCSSSFKPGNGLTGMQERLAQFNGRAELIPQETGCRLSIILELNNA